MVAGRSEVTASGPVADDETTPERVLRLATDLFAQRGFDATGVQELSEATGLGRGALYYHIKSKQELLLRIATRLLERAIDNAEEIVARDVSVPDRLTALTEYLITDLMAERSAWMTSMRDWTSLDEAGRAKILAMRDHYESIWQRLFDEGAELGVTRRVDPTLRKAIVGMFTSIHSWLAPHGALSAQEISATYLDFMLHGVMRE
ncbi:TetR/AcrR family transcriptional regulator [Pseudonocardia sp. McavD-2-B]|uniref:TetR/AcrR family transcriptional regulator n=1 Tax=Pseudonocardia sp. McavD-2-B TaxID=2954499 RepID=UPI002097268E|nr:TetR/AcrR family transcriptional regulator [Pseudonocardia sp. McavD-2-B]MCO7191503.1 TetR/AcrR family transcriptional regulator [Pseudonocardia sp. McavD-2-B]